MKKKNKDIEPIVKENNVDMTSKELEALGASKAATLRENDRKLAEDKENERKKEEKNKKIRRVLEIAALILFILLLLARCSVGELPTKEDNNINLGFEDTDNNENIKVKPVGANTFEFITMSMNKVPIFEDGLSKGQLNICNKGQNIYALYVEIYLDNPDGKPYQKEDGTLDEKYRVYHSNLILVGQTLPWDDLDMNLPAGAYGATAYFYAVKLTDEAGKDYRLGKDTDTGELIEVEEVWEETLTEESVDEMGNKIVSEKVVEKVKGTPFTGDLNALTQSIAGYGGVKIGINILKTAVQ